MATLVLTAVGTIVGGPLGGAIGGLIGSQVDQAIFTPKGAHGARLGSLAAQSSTYGSELPRVFGTMRLAGSVIWATDLVEDRHHAGGKGQPKTTTYSYSMSFAVALSARPIRSIGRIWADGNLLRGAGGDWKSDVGAFRLHSGDEAQAVDPLIAAAEGIGATPAYRGLAYVVFEHLQLADYGNRIPSLSFEVTADDGAVSLAAIAGDLSGGAVRGVGGPLLAGYAAGGDSVRGAIEGLAQALPVAFASGAPGLMLIDEAADPVAIAAAELGARGDDKRVPRLTIDRAATGTLNEALTISYHDPARDGQTGSQGARRAAAGRRTGTIQLPASVSAADARAIAEARLAREWAGRTRATVTLPRSRLDIAAGTIVTLPGEAGVWRVTRRTLDTAGVTIEAVRLPGGAGVPSMAAAGRATLQSDRAQGPTRIEAIDLPIAAATSDPPTLRIAAGGGAGWRKAVVIGSTDGGASWPVIGTTAPAAIMGRSLTLLSPGQGLLFDEAATIDILLDDPTDTLLSDDRLGWTADGNLALIGDELVQFGVAASLGGARWRLSRMLRGRRGTEWAAGDHAIGERFVLIEAATLLGWTLPASATGTEVAVSANGIGDVVPAEATIRFGDAARVPPAPVALRGVFGTDGSLALGWVRRSRDGWVWRDDNDAPLVEETERYRITIARGGTGAVFGTTTPSLVVPAPAGSGAIEVAIVQIGTFGASRAAHLVLTGVEP